MQCDGWVASSVSLYLPFLTSQNIPEPPTPPLLLDPHWDSFRSLPPQLSKLIFKQIQ